MTLIYQKLNRNLQLKLTQNFRMPSFQHKRFYLKSCLIYKLCRLSIYNVYVFFISKTLFCFNTNLIGQSFSSSRCQKVIKTSVWSNLETKIWNYILTGTNGTSAIDIYKKNSFMKISIVKFRSFRIFHVIVLD